LTQAAHTDPDAEGDVSGSPFPVPAAWVKLWVAKDPSLDLSKITYSRFTQLLKQSQTEYDKTIGTDDPDLSGFRKSGGKLLTWHGEADQYIPTRGTVQYRQKVERDLGGGRKADDFYRLFLAPGTNHCGLNGLDGSADGLAALTAWVEHGKAPRTLSATLINAEGQSVSRDLCGYPQVPRYKGHGDPAVASSFTCVSPSRH
jgi:feruloyl esterase